MGQVRRRRRVNAQDKDKAGEAISRLNAIAIEQRNLKGQQEKIDKTKVELGVEAGALMKFLKIEELNVPGHGMHEFKPGRTNAKNVVDPKGFMEAAGENAFWATANVPVGEAKKHLGEKELSTITITTPGGKTPAAYKFK